MQFITPQPPAKVPETNLSAYPIDYDQRRFFALLGELPLEDFGVTLDDVRRYYRDQFNVESMNQLTQFQWAICAAEAQAMVESIQIFLSRIERFRPPRLGFHLCPPCYYLHEIDGHGTTLTRPIDPPRDRYCNACRRKSASYKIAHGHNLDYTGTHAGCEYYFSKGGAS